MIILNFGNQSLPIPTTHPLILIKILISGNLLASTYNFQSHFNFSHGGEVLWSEWNWDRIVRRRKIKKEAKRNKNKRFQCV